MNIIVKGAPKALSVIYFEYLDGPYIDPASVELEVLDPNNVVVVGFPVTYPGDVERTITGHYNYTWIPDNDIPDGIYTAHWTGIIDGEEEKGYETFRVQTSSPTTANLGEQFILNFVTELSPLYVDPEDLQIYFPEVPLSEIAVEIYYASLYVEPYLVDGQPTDLIREYVEAAAACALSRNYDTSGNYGMGGNEESVTLGDLSVKSSSGSSSRGGAAITRGNAATWCELAMVLRKELGRSKTGMRATQKAVSWPSRHASRDFDRVPRRYNF
jgi:hypothetical protein